MADLSLVHLVRPPAAGANGDGVRPPLLIVMHGVGSNERSMATLAPAFDPRFVVLSVRSPLMLGADSFAWFHVTFGPQGPVINGAEAEAGWGVIARFIDEAVVAYGADPARVFVAGFSQGGIMSLAALLTSPGKIAGAACMSGRLLPEVLSHAAPRAALAGKPVVIVHGTEDQKLVVQYARSAREALAPFALEITYQELPIGHQVTRESLGVVTAWLTSRLDRELAGTPA